MKTETARKLPSNNHDRRRIIPIIFLELSETAAQSVCIASSFNDWRPEAGRMIYLGDGCWIKELSLPPGEHQYRLVVDGEWIPDPLAEDYVHNPFGGINSVLMIPSSEPGRQPAGRAGPNENPIAHHDEFVTL